MALVVPGQGRVSATVPLAQGLQTKWLIHERLSRWPAELDAAVPRLCLHQPVPEDRCLPPAVVPGAVSAPCKFSAHASNILALSTLVLLPLLPPLSGTAAGNGQWGQMQSPGSVGIALKRAAAGATTEGLTP